MHKRKVRIRTGYASWTSDVFTKKSIYQCRCGLQCEFHNEVPANQADALFDVEGRQQKVERAGQLYGIMNIEPHVEATLPANEFTVTYRQSTKQNVWITYADQPIEGNRVPDIATKMNQSLILFASSRCVDHRDAFVTELMKYLPVVSTGKCLHNAEEKVLHPECYNLPKKPGQTAQDAMALGKICTMNNYRFMLCLENTLTDDYVTEKLLWTWVADTVPIYRGARNSRDYAPNVHSYINAYDFSSPRELAEYIKLVGNNPKLYEEFFQWRTRGQEEKFREVQARRWDRSHCNICEYVAEHVGQELWD